MIHLKAFWCHEKKKNNFAKQPTGGGAVSRYQIYAYDNPNLHQLLVWISFLFSCVTGMPLNATPGEVGYNAIGLSTGQPAGVYEAEPPQLPVKPENAPW